MGNGNVKELQRLHQKNLDDTPADYLCGSFFDTFSVLIEITNRLCYYLREQICSIEFFGVSASGRGRKSKKEIKNGGGRNAYEGD